MRSCESRGIPVRPVQHYLKLLSRRLNAEPTGYIVGAVELLGLRFKVDRRGFISRLDLPVLINAGLERVPREAAGFALEGALSDAHQAKQTMAVDGLVEEKICAGVECFGERGAVVFTSDDDDGGAAVHAGGAHLAG